MVFIYLAKLYQKHHLASEDIALTDNVLFSDSIKIILHVVEGKLGFLKEADPDQAPAIAASDQVPATVALWPYCWAPALATVEQGWP